MNDLLQSRNIRGEIGLLPIKRVFLLLLIALVTGCNYPGALQAPTIDLVSTAVAGTLAAEGADPQASTTPAYAITLPRPVFFVSGSGGAAQIWRLETDGTTQIQITDEPMTIDGYDISLIDGSIAYVTDNQLYLVDADGSNRRLMVDNAAADPEAEDYFHRQRISDLRFSPDGRMLAYALNGVWILDLTTNQATQMLMNELEETEEGIFPEAFYVPLLWAPDEERLLVTVGSSQGSSVSILNVKAGQFVTDLESNDVLCCQVSWTPDGSSVLVASPYIGIIEPGLWRYDAETGKRKTLAGFGDDGLFQFVGWPLQLTNDSLRYFYTSSTEIPAQDLPLFMMSSDLDGETNRVQLRPDSFSNIGEVLWAEDGSLALIVQLKPSGGTSGSVILAYSDGRQLQNLLIEAQQLRWGP